MPQKFGNSQSDIPQWQIAKYLTTILNQKKDSPWTFIFNSKLEDTHNNTMSLRSQIQAHNRSLITCFGWHIILYLQNRYTPQASHLLKQGPQYSSPKHILTKSDLITQNKYPRYSFFPILLIARFATRTTVGNYTDKHALKAYCLHSLYNIQMVSYFTSRWVL